jgi:ABC-2 type transport system ATP-binding protein
MPAAVSARGVSKKYRIFSGGRDRLKEALSFGRRKYGRDFWALKDINLEVEPGTTLGILGRNGAGKSTLLGIIAGILQPTSGTVEVNGRLVALSGMGAGFNKEFTGRENVILNGLILGMEYREILERFDDIAAFADIGDFMDQPIKTYSSGMRSRLGFAVAVNVEPDVLILDETLAVGDAVYRETALQKMYELRDSGTTILFVSHSTKMVEDFCTEAILLHKGRMLASGETTDIIDRYQRLISKSKTRKNQRETGDKQPSEASTTVSGEQTENLPSGENSNFERRAPLPRDGARAVKIRSVELLDEHLHPVETVAPDSTVTVRVQLEYLEAVKNSELTVTLHNDAGLEVFSADTAMEGIPLEEMKKGERAIVDFTFEIPLQHGAYSVTAAARAGGSEDLYLDRVEAAAAFEISRPRNHSPFRGIVHLPVEIKVHTPEGERQGRSA